MRIELKIDGIWYHVTNKVFTELHANSTVTQWRELGEAFSHQPSQLEYDENYKDYSSKEDSEFLTGEDRAFVNAMSMTFPREDRAAIFACALMDGNEAVFQSETLQAKLRQICKGIREAFEWKRDERVFPWEQYLNQSIAYQN